ncbi:hypothetical protein OG594_44850 [Streptomyces sp. NBC_01214]|uniref:hypothetical protein n=1 Tax=Streptomyces sp. NBC_01214 TaxID=2903777 RepID=UPI0022529AB3|nr:hypothetical protein [Streptomyces sp. NBC_01214]MCX4808628.1 hypothetical protein [Streptomyces sp. NBC_01214]
MARGVLEKWARRVVEGGQQNQAAPVEPDVAVRRCAGPFPHALVEPAARGQAGQGGGHAVLGDRQGVAGELLTVQTLHDGPDRGEERLERGLLGTVQGVPGGFVARVQARIQRGTVTVP